MEPISDLLETSCCLVSCGMVSGAGGENCSTIDICVEFVEGRADDQFLVRILVAGKPGLKGCVM